MVDRADDDIKAAPAGQAIACDAPEVHISQFLDLGPKDIADFVEIFGVFNAMVIAWRERVPEARFVFLPPHYPVRIHGLLMVLRRFKRSEVPGLRTIGSAKMKRYVDALRTIAELAPDLQADLAAELGETAPRFLRVKLEVQNDFSMMTTLLHFASAGDWASKALQACEAVAKHDDPRRHWHHFALWLGRMVASELMLDAERRGVPAPATSLRNPESLAARLSVALLAIGGLTVTADAFAALHRTVAKS